MKNLIALLFACLSLTSFGQVTFEGFVRASDNGEPVSQVYVVNRNTEKNVLTNDLGFFSIEVSESDSIIFSHLAFNFTYYIMPDSIADDKVIDVVVLNPRNYLLDEVSIETYELTTNQPRPIKLNDPHVPTPENVEYPMDMREPSLNAPVDLLYYYFGSRPRQLRELRELQKQDAYRVKLREGQNREILTEITGLSPEELEAFAFGCKYGNTPISSVNDYDLLVSLLNCYNEYLEMQKQSEVMDDAENGW